MGQAITGDSDTVVADVDFGVWLSVLLTEATDDFNGCLFVGVFHGIVQQVAEHVRQVGTVGGDGQLLRGYLQGDTDRLVGFQLMLFDEGRQDLF